MTTTDQKKLDILFKKYQKGMFNYYELKDFKEPLILLTRKTGKTDFLENIKENPFEYTHTDGTTRTIKLIKPYLLNYGKKKVNYYLCDEDLPFSLPHGYTPTLLAEQHKQAIDTVSHVYQKWQAKLEEAKSIKWQYLVYAIAILIVGYIVYILVRPEQTTQTQPIQIITNLTQLLPGG